MIDLMLMELIHLGIWIFIIYGTTQVIVETQMFNRIRESVKDKWRGLYKLLTCFLCVSVWVSFVLSWTFWSPTSTFFYYTMDYLNPEMLAGDDLFTVMKNVLSLSLIYLRKLIFMFADGMFGSAIVWLIHIWEVRNTTSK